MEKYLFKIKNSINMVMNFTKIENCFFFTFQKIV